MKHAAATIWDTVEPGCPKHALPWDAGMSTFDQMWSMMPYTPGKHAKPFAAHHPARPVTYDAAGATTPLNPPTHALDTVA